MNSANSRNENIFKLASIFFLILAFFIIDLLAPELFPTIFNLTLNGDLDAIINFLQGYGVWAIVASFFLDILINAAGFLPSIFISTANGILFGLPIGILVSWLAETVGVTISFVLMRYFFRDSAEKIISKSKILAKINNQSLENGFKFMLIARMLPYFPSGILTSLGAVSKITFRDYFIANLIGKFPSTALEVVLGHDIVNYEQNKYRLGIILTILLVLYVFYLYKEKKKM